MSVPVEESEVDRALGPDAAYSDYVAHWGAVRPARIAFRSTDFSQDRNGTVHEITFAELDRWSRALATRITVASRPGDRAAILTPAGAGYAVAFAATLRSHAIGVPLFDPEHLGQGDRLRSVLADCRPAVLLIAERDRHAVEALVASLPEPLDVAILAVDDARDDDEAATAWERPPLSLGQIAYLQYTSGSTRAPAGVELTHGAVVANGRQIRTAFDVRDDRHNTTVSWLPLFHDMGLLLGVVVPGLVCATSDNFEPLAFIQRPLRWMKAVARQPYTFTAAPNFAFGYAAKRIKAADRETLDLSGVAAMLNAAEPVHPKTMRVFLETFTPCGLRPEAVRPSYGLAEATVFVSTVPSDRPARITKVDAAALQEHRAVPAAGDVERVAEIVSCGLPVGQQIAIVEPATRVALTDGLVGEVWVHGNNVGSGYWGTDRANVDTFGAVLEQPGDLPGQGWLRTGDLGVVIDGELYVTGRLKDTIIIDGRNIYPNDIEATVEEAHDIVAAHRLAAFAVETTDGEGLVVVAERHREAEGAALHLEAVAAAARQAVSVQHAVALHDFVLVEPHTVPRTSSGKIARQATRSLYLEHALPRVGDLA